ncbi:NUDIX domain-containing protein, partial [Streptomyces katrae]|uniref:NUDIX domain-containing protein n=1 Tax=Streptomyces katrae TaxID=68223 RepID=UPI000AB6A2B8
GEAPAAAIVRELDEEAGLTAESLTELFETRDEHGSGQIITFFAATWDGDETRLPLSEGVKLQFFAPEHLDMLTIPPVHPGRDPPPSGRQVLLITPPFRAGARVGPSAAAKPEGTPRS